jgi:hypothetical protein
MPQIHVRFYAELNDFLAPDLRGREFVHAFFGSPTLRDVIEGLGPPHTEVDLLLVDGAPSPDSRRLQGGERVSVYPAWRAVRIHQVPGEAGDEVPRFVLDVHLGRLARLLRLLGFDCLYANDMQDAALARVSAVEGRVLLSRDRGLLKRGIVKRGGYVHSQAPREQAVEVLRRLRLQGSVRPFTRCLECNGELRPAAPAEVQGRVPERLRRELDRFVMCQGCGRAYWPGSHFDRLHAMVSAIVSEAGGVGSA